jgi:uncharacterized protein (DUF427 family)
MKAVWKDKILASSEHTVVVEGNHYFPPSSVDMNYLKPSNKTTSCPWKGTANYYDVQVDGQTNEGAAWYYASPKPDASHIAGLVAFWRGVEVIKD